MASLSSKEITVTFISFPYLFSPRGFYGFVVWICMKKKIKHYGVCGIKSTLNFHDFSGGYVVASLSSKEIFATFFPSPTCFPAEVYIVFPRVS